jgi:hypothetical protein
LILDPVASKLLGVIYRSRAHDLETRGHDVVSRLSRGHDIVSRAHEIPYKFFFLRELYFCFFCGS